MRVNVTAKDITHGKSRSAGQCPIARALHRHKGFEKAQVDGKYVYALARYPLPEEAQKFIMQFDCRTILFDALPFSFELKIV